MNQRNHVSGLPTGQADRQPVTRQIQSFQSLQVVKKANIQTGQTVIGQGDRFQFMTILQHFAGQSIDLIIAQVKIVEGTLVNARRLNRLHMPDKIVFEIQDL